MGQNVVKRMAGVLVLWVVFWMPRNAASGAWTLPRGHFWSKMTFMAQSTDEEYLGVGGQGRPPDPAAVYVPGDRARYRFDGSYRSRAAFFDLFYGLTDRFDVGVQVPFFWQEFQDEALLTGFGEPRVSSGFSDVRGMLKFRMTERPFVGTLKFGFKAPTGTFVNADGLIPVGEGQWDFDFVLQVGRSFWPFPGYAGAELGYRLRLKNEEIDRNPGEEWFFLVEAGYHPADRVLASVKLEGIRGEAATTFGIKSATSVKRITYLTPTLGIGPFSGMSFEAAVRVTLNGRNFPAGQMLVVGLSYTGNPFTGR